MVKRGPEEDDDVVSNPEGRDFSADLSSRVAH